MIKISRTTIEVRSSPCHPILQCRVGDRMNTFSLFLFVPRVATIEQFHIFQSMMCCVHLLHDRHFLYVLHVFL